MTPDARLIELALGDEVGERGAPQARHAVGKEALRQSRAVLTRSRERFRLRHNLSR